MKRITTLILILSLCIVLSGYAYAHENADILSSTDIPLHEKLDYLEVKWGVTLLLNDGVDDISTEELYKLDSFLEQLTSINFDPPILLSRRVTMSTLADGTFNGSWDTAVNEKVASPDGKVKFDVKGTIRTTWRYTKNTVSGKVYVSGSVTDCRFLAGSTYTGSVTFVGGRLNIEGNGTTCATINPEADMSFEIIYQTYLTVIFEHTFNSCFVDFILPS